MESSNRYTFEIGGKEVTFETGRLANSASGSVLVRCEDTVLLVTATVSKEPRPGIDFFPLLIDYEEKMYSVGKIPGGFLRKEGKASDKAILISRLIDRPIRPLFPKGYRNDVQIVATVLSSDQIMQPDTLAVLGASCALELSGAPFEGPISAVRVSEVDGNFVVNPTYEQANNSKLDIVVAGTEDSVIMVEAGCNFVSEEEILNAVKFAHDEIKRHIQAQKEFVAQCGVVKEQFVNPFDTTELKNFIAEIAEQKVFDAYHNFDRDERKRLLEEAKEAVNAKIEELPEDSSIKTFLASSVINFLAEEFKALEKRIMRAMIINEGVRADGRKNNEVRPIWCQTGILPRTHGSAIFTRGQTQVLSVATLAGPGMAQNLEGIDPQTEKRYMHNYLFPGYSVGEVKPMRGPGRREIGHGALAERAVQPSLPSREEFGYVIRVTSDVLESNGSTSMASTCGSSMALMDAGVPVKTIVGGVAMGLIKEADKAVVLTDIQGIEDFLGDMDFKVTGNKEGITALQMDIKIKGLDMETLARAINDAKAGRIHIIDKMMEAISSPNTELSKWAPRIETMKIAVEDIGPVIGPGGKNIKAIIEETGTEINIEDDGTVTITSVDGESCKKAIARISAITRKVEEGLVFQGKVLKIIPIGAIVEIGPGKDGMVHISQIANERVEKVEDRLSVGDEVIAKVLRIDERGRVNLSMKAVTEEEKQKVIQA